MNTPPKEQHLSLKDAEKIDPIERFEKYGIE